MQDNTILLLLSLPCMLDLVVWWVRVSCKIINRDFGLGMTMFQQGYIGHVAQGSIDILVIYMHGAVTQSSQLVLTG